MSADNFWDCALIQGTKGVRGVAGGSGFQVSFRRCDLWEWLQSDFRVTCGNGVDDGCGFKK